MVDNFELIKSMFYFNEANDMFFHCQIVQRAKDHKGERAYINVAGKDFSAFCCSQCGGTNIQVQAWVNANTNEYVDDIGEGECWCEDCQKHTTIREIK